MEQAREHLASVDRVLRSIIKKFGDCTLSPRRDHFTVLADAIVSQQISVRAAATIFRRLKEALGGRITPRGVLALTGAAMRSTGISRQKASYLRDLAAKWADGTIQPRQFSRLTDEEIIVLLTRVRGIGRWTAEMFLIFSLTRLDVLPVDDLGFQKAIQQAYGLRRLPAARTIRRLAEPWRPYRSVATWYLWRSLENGLTPH